VKNEESKREQSYLVVETVDDEIDLYELFLIIKRRFKWVILTLLSVVSFAVMYLYFTSPIFLLSHTYRDNLISFNRNFSVYPVAQSIASKVNSYISDGNYKSLEDYLSLREETVKSLKSISIEPLTRGNYSVFQVKIKGKTRDYLPKIDAAFRKKLFSSPAVERFVRVQRESLESQLEAISKQLQELQPEINRLKGQLLSGKVKVLGFNPLDLNKTFVELKTQEAEIRSKLALLVPCSTVSLYSPEKPVAPKVPIVLAVSIFSGFFLGLFVAFFVEWLEGVRKRREEA